MDYFLKWFARLEWLNWHLRGWLTRKFCHPGKIASLPFEVDYYGYRYRGNLNSLLDWYVYYFGAYEKEELQLFKAAVKDIEGAIFLDIGANVGLHSIFMSRYCKEIHAFEPNPEVREIMERQISLNSLKNITIHPVGLSNQNDEIPFYAPFGCNKGTGSFINGFSENNKNIGTLKIVNGDDYIEKMNLPSVDLIKVDVEGYEKAVLSGLKKTIEKFQPTLIVEFTQITQKSFDNESEFRMLFPDNYLISSISCNRTNLIFFNDPSCHLCEFDFDSPGKDLYIRPS